MATLVPILSAHDIDQTIGFYRDVLGFEVTFTMADAEGRTVHAELNSHGAGLMLGPANGLSEAARSLLGAGVVLYLTDNDVDIDGYYARVRGAGAAIAEEITDQFWGDRTFSVRDPNGYVLMFARNVHAFDPAKMPASV